MNGDHSTRKTGLLDFLERIKDQAHLSFDANLKL
jgi:hypothetical protein